MALEQEDQEQQEQEPQKKERKKRTNQYNYQLNHNGKRKVGLGASTDLETIKRVVFAAAFAPHQKRGLEASDMATRLRVAKAGGNARANDIESIRAAGIKRGNKTKELFGFHIIMS